MHMFEQSVVSGQCDRNRVSEFLLLNVHGGEKAYLGRGRVGKGGVEE